MNFNPLEYAKSHPWTTGTVVIIGGLVFISISGVFGGSGGSSGGAVDSGPSDAEIAANAAIASAQIQAQAAQAQAGASLQAAQIGAGVQMHGIDKEAEVSLRELEVNQSLGLANIDASKTIGLAQTDADKAKSLAAIDAQVKVNQIIAGGQASQAKSASKSSMLSSVASVATAAFAFFSDERLKENIVKVGVHPNGYGIYEFNYKGDSRRMRGVIANEVRAFRPDLVIEGSNGYLKVKPQALAA